MRAISNQRIRYTWGVLPSNAGHFRYGTWYPTIYQRNPFIPDRPGNCQIFYIVSDAANGYADTSAYKTVQVKAKLVIDKPRKDTTFWISPAPLMPQIKCRARIAGMDTVDQQNLSFNWKIDMEYYGLHLIRQGSITGVKDWIPNFGTDFGGGSIKLDVGVKCGAESLTAHYVSSDGIRVLGRNPDTPRQATVETYINSLTQYRPLSRSSAKGAACYENQICNYCQFYDSGPNIGFPYREVGGGGGWGIMQLTFAAYVTRNSIWSWHENVKTGTLACDTVYNSAVNNFHHDSLPGYEPTDQQLTKQILAKYNGGPGVKYHKYYGLPINDFVRDTTYCADCGACNSRTGEHFKTQQHDFDCIRDCDSHTPYCYSDGAYNCAH